jgi:hypothetical protein
LSYYPAPALQAWRIEFPFIVGSIWSRARFVEVVVEKPRELAEVPMTLHMEPVHLPGDTPKRPYAPGELVFHDRVSVMVRAGDFDIGEIVAAPGTVWRPHCSPSPSSNEVMHGAHKVGRYWQLLKSTSAVGFAIPKGELCRMALSFVTPRTLKPGSRPLIRIFQRNDRKMVTGGVLLEIRVSRPEISRAEELEVRARKPRTQEAPSRRTRRR